MYAVRSNETIRIYDSFAYRGSIKDMQDRFYDADDKCWVVPLTKENVATLGLLGATLDEELQALTADSTDTKGNAEPTIKSPIKGSLYSHQVKAYNFALKQFDTGKAVAFLMDMGTGKTITTIALIGALNGQKRIGKVLVVSPKSIVGVREEEFQKFADYRYALTILDGSIAKKKAAFGYMNGSALQVIVVNYESAWRLETEIGKWNPDMIVCDESSKIKNPTTAQSKALHKLGKKTKFNVILTGTPVTNNPLDFFSQYKFLNEEILGPSYYLFRNRYAVMGGYQNHQIVGYNHLPELVEKVHKIAFRIKIQDAVDLPPFIDEVRTIKLEPKAEAVYRMIEEDCYAQLSADTEVTARNILTQLLRLSQCTGGFIRDDATAKSQTVSTAKIEALEDIIDSCVEEDKKVVVFARFVPEIEAIKAMLEKKKLGYRLIYGATKDRAEQVKDFQENPDVKVFVGQLQTTGMGLTLTAASVAVFYSLDFSYANYEQSRARIHRIGQKEKCLYIHLVAKNTVDEKIMNALKHKGDIVLCLDNDEPGQKATETLEKELQTAKIPYVVFNVAGDKKDPNELLMSNPEELKASVAAAKREVRKIYKRGFASVTASDLQIANIPPPEWLIPDVLPQGLAILCASSKVGKSWMAMQMCLAISRGKEFLDYKTNQSSCLYLALEDSLFRLKERLNKVIDGDKAPNNFYLAIRANGMDGGLLQQIDEEFEEHPDIKLIIIDTLQKVRGSAKKDEMSYATDYRELGVLKEYADNKKICILLVHHLRKMADENDVFNMISGSNGIMGVTDNIFIIYKKKRKDENAVLFMTGRDIRQQDIMVHFNETKYRWDMVGTAEEEERKRKKREYENNPIVKTVKDLIKQYPMGWKGTATDLIKAVYDVTGSPCIYSTAALGKEIMNIETQLYYDGIEHSMKRSGSSRVHYFGKRQAYKPTYQQAIFDSDDDSEEQPHRNRDG